MLSSSCSASPAYTKGTEEVCGTITSPPDNVVADLRRSHRCLTLYRHLYVYKSAGAGIAVSAIETLQRRASGT
ncbi:hypothetical protein AAFF_G00294650 [Aldrovandia affinis]|uniref:Uncharacterized protein n=1 Tax=Aldrovandia affinis TaxID=143900 RepID=A0AAD7RBK3_9TELE|nr:hypothetical protein AAFF_G00294650 [Aldrovandia affinis]